MKAYNLTARRSRIRPAFVLRVLPPCLLMMILCMTMVRGQGTQAMKKTVITSDHLTYDYKRLIAMFKDNVVVVDPQIRMESDRMNVLFSDDNAIKSVTASGNVRMFNEGKVAACKRAIYIAHDGQVILKGDVKLKQGQDLVEGNEITIWLHEDRMVVKPARLVIQGAGGGGRSNPLSGLKRNQSKAPSGQRQGDPGS